MKYISFIVFLAVFSTSLVAATPKKAAAKKGTPAKKTAARGKKSRASPPPGATTASRSRQAVPSPERYKEIQEALVQKGYLKSEPNGVWDAGSMQALKQYQSENKLSPTGKLSSASLISLGLGPKTTPEPIPPPSPVQPPEPRP